MLSLYCGTPHRATPSPHQIPQSHLYMQEMGMETPQQNRPHLQCIYSPVLNPCYVIVYFAAATLWEYIPADWCDCFTLQLPKLVLNLALIKTTMVLQLKLLQYGKVIRTDCQIQLQPITYSLFHSSILLQINTLCLQSALLPSIPITDIMNYITPTCSYIMWQCLQDNNMVFYYTAETAQI